MFWVAAACAGAPAEPAGANDIDIRGIAIPASACGDVAADSDRDLLGDACELHLARAFAPLLVVAPEGCNWDDSVHPARLGGEYYFGVQPAGHGSVRIAYMPAYYRDCGWRGSKCWLPLVDCGPHAGDSEIIVVDVRQYGAGRWVTEAVFLSAHCFGRSDGDCRWYAGEDLASFAWVDRARFGAPIVWVAEGRQANYRDRGACDRGHFRIDTCDANRLGYRFPIASAAQNIGSRSHPIGRDGCVGPDAAGWRSARVDPSAIECFWTADTPFRGWQMPSDEPGATSYARYLEQIADF